MIKEIKFPLPTIFDKKRLINSKFYRRDKKRKKAKHKTYDYIAFDRDYSFVEEFADICDIPVDYAETILVVFFDELKHSLLRGEEFRLINFGKFIFKNKLFTFRASSALRRKLRKAYNIEGDYGKERPPPKENSGV